MTTTPLARDWLISNVGDLTHPVVTAQPPRRSLWLRIAAMLGWRAVPVVRQGGKK